MPWTSQGHCDRPELLGSPITLITILDIMLLVQRSEAKNGLKVKVE